MINDRIRELRQAKGLTQVELGERIGKDQVFICKIETGKRRVYSHEVPLFALALGVSISDLYDDTPSRVKAV